MGGFGLDLPFFLHFIPQVVDSRSFRADSVIGEFRVRPPPLSAPPVFPTLTRGVDADSYFPFFAQMDVETVYSEPSEPSGEPGRAGHLPLLGGRFGKPLLWGQTLGKCTHTAPLSLG